MAKKAPAKRAPAKRKPRNAIVDNAPQLAELAKRMEAERARIIAEIEAEEAEKKKPEVPVIQDNVIELTPINDEITKRIKEILDAENPVDTFDSQVGWKILASLKHLIPCVLSLVVGAAAGAYAAGGIEIGPDGGGKQDVLSDAHAADRATQVKVLRELAEQPFDGATDDGRSKAGEWFNAQRFRNRAADFGGYTDRVAEAIAANEEAKFADELEAK